MNFIFIRGIRLQQNNNNIILATVKFIYIECTGNAKQAVLALDRTREQQYCTE